MNYDATQEKVGIQGQAMGANDHGIIERCPRISHP